MFKRQGATAQYRHFLLLALLIGICTANIARAGDPATQIAQTEPQLDAALAPFVTAGTLIVAKIDVSRIDLSAIQSGLVSASGGDLKHDQSDNSARWLAMSQSPSANRWLSDFRRAGATIVYAVAFLGEPEDIPGVLIVPFKPSDDPRALAGLLVSGAPTGPDHADNAAGGCEAIELNNAVVYGLTIQVERMKLARQVDRPLFAEALAALGDAPIKIAFSPSIALQLVAGELLPERLSDAAGGAAPADLVHSLQWAAVGTSPPPTPSFRVLIQCHDPDGAQSYVDMFNALLNTMDNDPAQRKSLPKLDQFVAALRPTLQKDLVSLQLDSDTLDNLIVPQFLLAVAANFPAAQAVPATQPGQ